MTPPAACKMAFGQLCAFYVPSCSLQAAEAQCEALQQQLDAARDMATRLEASLAAQVAAAAEAAAGLAAAEAALAEERAARAATKGDDEALRQDFERMVAAGGWGASRGLDVPWLRHQEMSSGIHGRQQEMSSGIHGRKQETSNDR